MNTTNKEDSLTAAIEGNDAGMSKEDLVLTVQMLRNGRKLWMDEANQLRAERDELKAYVSQIATGLGKLRARYSILAKQLCPDDSYGPDDETIDKACNVICKERDQLKAELERVKSLSPVMPGAWRCPKCNFTLQKNTLHTGDGSISADTSPLNEKCPNDGQLMKPLTWREANDDFFTENQKLRSQLAGLMGVARAMQNIANLKDAPDIDATGDWQKGLHCGVEDRNCRNRYDGADYGHTVGVEKGLEWAKNEATAALAALREKFPDLLK